MMSLLFRQVAVRKTLKASISRERVTLTEADPQQIVCNASKMKRYLIAKRLMDVTVVILAAPAVLMVLGVGACAIRLTMGSPILYRQARVGLNGRAFTIYKLRTMGAAEDKVNHATLARDPRITPVGAVLRRTHIDELPQLWNILRGDMTLIGPRPEQCHLVDTYRASIPHFDLRHCVVPGLSGWSQVRYGYAADAEDTRQKLEYDLFYIQQFGFWMDVRIIVLTFAIYLNPRFVR